MALLAVGCGTGDRQLTVPAGPDRVVTSSRGDPGQFVVECGFDRFLADDPIVLPNRAGASHLHQFFGAVGVTVDSTDDEMRAGETTCDRNADTASYWAPALLTSTGSPLEPTGAVSFYRAGPDVEPTEVVPFPPGFMMVAGDHAATTPQPLSLVAWSCGGSDSVSDEPIGCGGSGSLRMSVTFPDCWDGVHARSPLVPTPNAHVAYSTAGECPADHPVHVPQLQFAVDWAVPETVEGLMLSSGDIHSGHADFWNAWDQSEFRLEVIACIHRGEACSVAGSSDEVGGVGDRFER